MSSPFQLLVHVVESNLFAFIALATTETVGTYFNAPMITLRIKIIIELLWNKTIVVAYLLSVAFIWKRRKAIENKQIFDMPQGILSQYKANAKK